MSYSHKAKNLISIKDFRVGTRTYGDTEASDADGKFSKLQNVETDKKGMLYKRDPSLYITTADLVISKIAKWFNTKLYSLTNFNTNPFNQNSCFIAFGTNSGNDKIQVYHPTNFGWEETLGIPGTAGGTCQIMPFADHVRFANWSASDDTSRDVSVWTYNHDTAFFYGLYTSAELIADGKDGFNYGDAHLGYPASWSHYSISDASFGNLASGYYYYKIVGVYDGVQEMELPDAYAYTHIDNDKGGTITILFDMDTDDFDPRIKQLKIYRGYAIQNIDVVYNHIATVELNTASGDEPETQTFTNMLGAGTVTDGMLIDESKDFSDAKYDQTTYGAGYPSSTWTSVLYVKIWVDGQERYLRCYSGSNSANGHIRLANVDDNDHVWFGKYEIVYKKYKTLGGGEVTYEPVDSGSEGSVGNNILLDTDGDNGNGGAEWKNHRFTNWSLTIGSTTVTILANLGNLFRLSGNHNASYSSSISASGEENKAKFTAVDSNTMRMQFTDTGYPDGAEHPLNGITKTKTNYKYGALHNGRIFGLHIALDPDDENEIHENWLCYSEYNQYDTIPVTNVIPLVDVRGGKGMGVISAGGYLICFTETGVFRVNVPTVDPSGWEVEQGLDSMGCTAPHSIIQAEGIIFFANATGIWALTPHDFQVYEITYDIKDQYLDASNHENTRITYDIKKRRLLCTFGDTVTTQHCFDIEMFLSGNQTHWTSQLFDDTATLHYAPYLSVVDENHKVYSLNHWTNVATPSTAFSQLYGGVGGAETLSSIITTPWLSVEDIDFNVIWRKLGLVLKQLGVAGAQTEDITINIYQDKFETIDSTHGSTHTFDANTSATTAPYVSLTIVEEIIRLAMRSTFIKVEIITTKTNSNDFELHRLELEAGD